MLRQLASLTRRLPAAGPNALAVAVYANSTGETFAARETGEEGVACVDDAARAVVLLSRLYACTGNYEIRKWAAGLLDFVLWMHAGEGLWFNFVRDWDGTRNVSGPTSAPAVNFWQGRATLALVAASLILEVPEAGPLLHLALEAAIEALPPADVRALHAIAALELIRRQHDGRLEARLQGWCDEMAACQREGMLMNSPDERGQPHLWGHVQEAVLADAAVVLQRPALDTLARRSAGAVFEAVIESGFALSHVQPYDVECAVYTMDRLQPMGGAHYTALRRKARAWFDGRNPAGAPVYVADSGRVADGVDNGIVNGHSGAEANICGGLALIEDARVRDRAASWPGPGWHGWA